MRLAIVSDIHGNLPALEAVVADLRRRGVDAVINLGDSLSGPLWPRETAQYLMESGWVHLAGNHERQVLDERTPRGPSDEYAREQLDAAQLDWLRGLQPSQAYADDVHLCHGTPASDLVYLLETVEPEGIRMAGPQEVQQRLGAVRAALVVCGHSHLPRSMRSAAGQLVVNPGSVGVPGYSASHPYPHVVQNGSPDARYAIVERGPTGWSAALISVAYDHKSAAQAAQSRGREEWHRALATGYVA